MYEYKCHKCGQVFELIQRFSDAPLTVHDACGGELEKVISAPAFHLKGSGWYATDYARKSGGPAKTDTKDAGGSGESDSASKSTEKKTESKTEPSGDGKKESKDKSDNRGSRD